MNIYLIILILFILKYGSNIKILQLLNVNKDVIMDKIQNIEVKNNADFIKKKIYQIFYIIESDKKNKNVIDMIKSMGFDENESKCLLHNVIEIAYILFNLYLISKCYNDISSFAEIGVGKKINLCKNIGCVVFLFKQNKEIFKKYAKFFVNLIIKENFDKTIVKDCIKELSGVIIKKISLINLFIEKLTVNLIKASHLKSDIIKTNCLKAKKIISQTLVSKNIVAENSKLNKIEGNEAELDNLNVKFSKSEKIHSKNLSSESIESRSIKSNNFASNNIESNVLNSDIIVGKNLDMDFIKGKQMEQDKIVVDNIVIESGIVKTAKIDDLECNSIAVTSDRRKKKNISRMDIKLEDLENLNCYKFQYDNLHSPFDEDTDFQIGLMAQEIEEIYPDLVVERGGVKKVNYIGLIPVLVENIKQLNKKFNQ